MITMFGTTMTGSNLQFEIMTGAFERILATPLSRAALMIGRALKELTPLVVQALVITLVAVPFGFRLYPLHIVVGLVILGVFGVGVGALSYALAIAARKTEWIFWAVQQTLLFPLLILSGMMLPLRDRSAVDADRVDVQPADLRRRRRAHAVRRGAGRPPRCCTAPSRPALTCAVGLWIGVRAIRGSTF